MSEELPFDWPVDTADAPLRSRLYRLEPIGLGTWLVESPSSYIHRIASAHGVPTWLLVCWEMAPRYRRKSILTLTGQCVSSGRWVHR